MILKFTYSKVVMLKVIIKMIINVKTKTRFTRHQDMGENNMCLTGDMLFNIFPLYMYYRWG